MRFKAVFFYLQAKHHLCSIVNLLSLNELSSKHLLSVFHLFSALQLLCSCFCSQWDDWYVEAHETEGSTGPSNTVSPQRCEENKQQSDKTLPVRLLWYCDQIVITHLTSWQVNVQPKVCSCGQQRNSLSGVDNQTNPATLYRYE